MRQAWRAAKTQLFLGACRGLAANIAILCFSLAWGAGVEAPSADPGAQLPEVLVTGEQPGPGLWRVSKGDHVLWVLGTIAVLPKHMKWQADGIDKILASSQAILSYPGIEPDAKIGPFAMIGLLPSLIGVEKLPDGATLQQVLSPAIYARWVAERQRIIGDSTRLERLRPFIAIYKLAEAAQTQAGLGDNSDVVAAVRKLAKKYNLKKVDAAYYVFIKDPKSAINTFKKTSIDENACFSYQLDELQHSLAEAALRANAWARGDVVTLDDSVAREQQDPCWQGFDELPFVKNLGLGSVTNRVDEKWLTVAEQTLAENRQSFALLEMGDVLLPKGLLAMLAARDYVVQGPMAGADKSAEH